MDGWSDIHNNPVVATSVTCDGKGYFVTLRRLALPPRQPRTVKPCSRIMLQDISHVRENYCCKVKTVVTDNAKNMEKMRKALEEEDHIVGYGCLAHSLNLLGQDLTPSQIIKHALDVNKYFRNHHIPGALLRDYAGSVKPQLPGDARWNSQLYCLDTYMTNRNFYMQIVQDHGEDIDKGVAQKIMNIGLYRQIKDLADQLRPIASGIDRAQSDHTCLADAFDIFYSLLEEPTLAPHRAKVQKRFDQAIQPCHLVAYMLHPKYAGKHMTMDQVVTAKVWLTDRDERYLGAAISFQAEADPFPHSFFKPAAKTMSAVTWWKGASASAQLPEGFVDLVIMLLSACASSASLESVQLIWTSADQVAKQAWNI